MICAKHNKKINDEKKSTKSLQPSSILYPVVCKRHTTQQQPQLIQLTKPIQQKQRQKPKFYWECRGQKFKYRQDKKYLVYFCGCFSPPHQGHFSVVDDAISQAPGIKVFIHQIGDEARHGVPFQLSRRIFKTYIHRLLPQDRVDLKPQISLSQLYNHRFLDDVDTVVIVRGNEQAVSATPEAIKRTEEKACAWFHNCIKIIQRRGKEVVFTYPERPLVGVLSATKFTEALIDCRHLDWGQKYPILSQFMPSSLPKGVARRIVTSLERCNLH